MAIKIVYKSKLSLSRLASLEEEIEILKSCDHQNIVKLHEVYEDSQNIYIVQELLRGGDLRQYLETRTESISEYIIVAIARQLIEALDYLKN